MPRGVRVDWTRDDLERVRVVSGETDVVALAEEIGVAPGTIYSVKSRIDHEGIDEILRKQSNRNERYTVGGGAAPVQTLEDQLKRVYSITLGRAGRGSGQAQYTVTIPVRVGEAWIERWGNQIRFVPTDEGLLIVPVQPPSAPEIPAWLGNGEVPA